MSTVGQSTWKAVKSHIPLIKFIKAINGQTMEKGLASGSSQPVSRNPQGGNISPQPSSINRTLHMNMMNELAISSKYSRKPPSDLEIETINVSKIAQQSHCCIFSSTL